VIRRSLVTLTLLTVLGAGGVEVCAQDADRFWRYDYFDGFDTTKAIQDSLRHSVFRNPQTPVPHEPYLSYSGNDGSAERGLLFMDNGGVPAHLEYRFPLDNTSETPLSRRIGGTIDFDIKRHANPEGSGSMFYRTSTDGVTWSPSVKAVQGRNRLWVSSPIGVVFVRFEGFNEELDNLVVHLRYGVAYHVNNRVAADVNNTGLNNIEPLADIQRAVNQSHPWDRIYVWPGTYTLQNTLQIQNKDILIQSIGEAAVL